MNTQQNNPSNPYQQYPNPGQRHQQKKKVKWWLWIIIVVVVLGIVGVILGEEDKKNTEKVEDTTKISESIQTPATTSALIPTEVKIKSEDNTKAETEDNNSNLIEIGKSITLGKYEVTIKDFSITESYDGKPCLKIVYDWANNSDKAVAPFVTVSFKGFQNGVETDSLMLMAKDVDLGISQKEVKPGATISDVEYAIGIEDMNQPLEIELYESFSLRNNKYIYTIDDLNNLE